MSDRLDCLLCGACCFSNLETYVRVTGDDHERLGEYADDLVCFVGNRAFMRMKEGHCAALVIDAEKQRFVCSVYERRPQTCRDLERGSPACAGEIATKGERPLVALRLAALGALALALWGCDEKAKAAAPAVVESAPSASAASVLPATTASIVEPRASRLATPLVDESGSCPSDMAQVYATCIDRYEAPNVPGEYPLVMESAITASAWCEKRGKRLCTEDEWERACSGPAQLAYPYGAAHEAARCVDEKEWIVKDESRIVMWPEKPAMTEVTKLYQAEKSGSRPKCVSGYGVFDMTGNVEEWVVAKKGRGHVLKGCYWSGCYGGSKPTCTSTNAAHAETFKFYETGFRCCKDAKRR